MDPRHERQLQMTRRHFFGRSSTGIGIAALASLMGDDLWAREEGGVGGLPGLPHFAPKAKRVIYLFQSGAPSQMELFDYKPLLYNLRGSELPDSIRRGQRLDRHDGHANQISGGSRRCSSSASKVNPAPGSAN